jgi:preprotein translocase subunit SecA
MSRTAVLGDVQLASGRPFPERCEEEQPWYDRVALQWRRFFLLSVLKVWRDRAMRRASIVDRVAPHRARFALGSEAELKSHALTLRRRLRRQGFDPALVGECFALIAEAASRTLGQRHYRCQFAAGWALLQGRLVEMATGEGKTFAATLPAIVAAWAGLPVHVITVNDYLAQRDADELAPLYEFVGLDVGTVVQGLSRAERRSAYSRAICYASNKEIAFDYLRDRVAGAGHASRLHSAFEQLALAGRPGDDDFVLRGLVFAIVDEADSVFIDEARTPLILATSVGADESRQDFEKALAIAAALTPGQDFHLDAANRRAALEDAGAQKLALHDRGEGVWSSARARIELVNQALTALYLLLRDRDYVVVDGKVQIVDESTGRVMADRSWERGLHQMVEVKEGCAATDQRQTLARITYQRLFRRYVRLAGMTGTASEVAAEVDSVYSLSTVRVPLNRPLRRIRLPDRVCIDSAAKWRAVVESVARLSSRDQRPVLIGTRSVRDSEWISALLTERGIAHSLLNAKQDQREAEIIADAGQTGRVTVATNMAGRGTDIKLGPGVAERGGLHVILTEYHESRRIDRQLLGRCARQGDPGSCQAIIAIDDELYRSHCANAAAVAARLSRRWPSRLRWVGRMLTGLAQAAAERRNALARSQTLKSDQRLSTLLSYSGRGE